MPTHVFLLYKYLGVSCVWNHFECTPLVPQRLRYATEFLIPHDRAPITVEPHLFEGRKGGLGERLEVFLHVLPMTNATDIMKRRGMGMETHHLKRWHGAVRGWRVREVDMVVELLETLTSCEHVGQEVLNEELQAYAELYSPQLQPKRRPERPEYLRVDDVVYDDVPERW